ncbi:hypothetical protein KSC_012180 [Ktedonobacter sp. SOSP1-52]|uniref:hypothetical protein n=1 Tax=Ktedonobacter sp. SOSP1-52 TaxID=2778366 RepID=UPI001915D2F6|nr:hypothetical protein [Ktedonobacter sp. SOSP1-52]GHO62326.1 hypothetical protein KSC_012180 [Ktedonobacter sp. SOSP1-52]
MFDARLYPAEWRALRRQKLEAAGYRCEACGVLDRSVMKSARTGEDYMVYLSIAHKKQYQTWLREAETMVLCQRCHRRYDRQFRRKGGARTYTPISRIDVYVQEGGRSVLAGEARTYDDLRDLVAAMPEHTSFEVHMVMHMAIVGNGLYVKEEQGGIVKVLAEYGACVGLAPQLPPLATFKIKHARKEGKHE